MKCKALVSFAGLVTMHKGEVRDIGDEYIVNDLVKAGYIEVEKPKAPAKKPKK